MPIKWNKGNKKVCLWIKEYELAFKAFGAILFFLALIVGVIWATGRDVEAVAFCLGMLSSLCFAAPSVAEYLLPNRKPIRHMTLDELIAFIPNTDYKNDWSNITRDFTVECFLKEDPRLRIRAKYTGNGIHNKNFVEPWLSCYSSSQAVSYWYDLYYDNAFIDRIILVSVDNHHAIVPPPRQGTNKIGRYEYSIAKISDAIGNTDEYIKRAKNEVES